MAVIASFTHLSHQLLAKLSVTDIFNGVIG